jgi:hypothetical protein
MENVQMKTFILRTFALVLIEIAAAVPSWAQFLPTVPPDKRGRSDAERWGYHDANNIRTRFWNYGMVGDYPVEAGNVNPAVFHSFEIPRGSGINYSDGGTPFVLAKILQTTGSVSYIMETGYRERQATSPHFNRAMKFEPRPGFFKADPAINTALSPAISNDPRTWPDTWPDKDHSWDGWWNGYFGKRASADEESYCVVDDDYYDGWYYYADSRDSSRHGLGLRLEMRGFQWSNPQAGNVLFTHYDVSNESTTDYPQNGQQENIIFGIYFDSGVGGEAFSCDGVYESDDDNAYFDRSTGINLTYTWDKYGHGIGNGGNCLPVGYLAYAYLETPGKPFDGIDDDDDGIVDERRDSGPGQLVSYPGINQNSPIPPRSPDQIAQGQQAIRNYITSHPEIYNLQKLEAFYGPLEKRPAFRRGYWWTGDENLDWDWQIDDIGADGLPSTQDLGEGDYVPTAGEPHFDQTDLNESDQVGLTGFKMNRITPGPLQDNIVFYNDVQNNTNWPKILYDKWTNPDLLTHWDNSVQENVNIGFLFASGPFTLKAGKRERFSLAAAYGTDLLDMYNTVKSVQAIYNSNYNFAIPPPAPTVTAETGDHIVQLTWDDIAENTINPVTGTIAFEGYRIYRSTDPDFVDPKVIVSARGTSTVGNGKPIAQFDLKDGISGYSQLAVDGVAYYLGSETGITHSYRDSAVQNGQQYYYAVCSYDYGPTINFGQGSYTYYPSENSIPVTRTPRGGTILGKNVVMARPNPKAVGYVPAGASQATHVAGRGSGTVSVKILESKLVPDGHVFKITFNGTPDAVHALSYNLIDSTRDTTLFKTGRDFTGSGISLSGKGVLPIVTTSDTVSVDTVNTGFAAGSQTNAKYTVTYSPDAKLSRNSVRTGFPDDLTITFSDKFLDTSATDDPVFFPGIPSKFKIVAHTAAGDVKLKFFFVDLDGNGTLNYLKAQSEYIDILTGPDSLPLAQRYTWRITANDPKSTPIMPSQGDVFALTPLRPFGPGDVFTFTTKAEAIQDAKAKEDFKNRPYVVPNPYVGAASFEPSRYLESGRGERRIEFRGLPQVCTIRIYTVRGVLVQTLTHDNSTDGYIAWNLRTKDNLDVAPGLYIYHVDGGNVGTFIGKFAIIK